MTFLSESPFALAVRIKSEFKNFEHIRSRIAHKSAEGQNYADGYRQDHTVEQIAEFLHCACKRFGINFLRVDLTRRREPAQLDRKQLDADCREKVCGKR